MRSRLLSIFSKRTIPCAVGLSIGVVLSNFKYQVGMFRPKKINLHERVAPIKPLKRIEVENAFKRTEIGKEHKIPDFKITQIEYDFFRSRIEFDKKFTEKDLYVLQEKLRQINPAKYIIGGNAVGADFETNSIHIMHQKTLPLIDSPVLIPVPRERRTINEITRFPIIDDIFPGYISELAKVENRIFAIYPLGNISIKIICNKEEMEQIKSLFDDVYAEIEYGKRPLFHYHESQNDQKKELEDYAMKMAVAGFMNNVIYGNREPESYGIKKPDLSYLEIQVMNSHFENFIRFVEAANKNTDKLKLQL